jgi:hypothetical protein
MPVPPPGPWAEFTQPKGRVNPAIGHRPRDRMNPAKHAAILARSARPSIHCPSIRPREAHRPCPSQKRRPSCRRCAMIEAERHARPAEAAHDQGWSDKTMISEFGRWQIEHEPVVTAECYAALPLGSGCTCHDCLNFMEALDSAFPPDFRNMAEQLGVDLCKPVELSHYRREPSGLHLSGGWFHLIGRIVSGADVMSPTGPQSWTYDFVELASGIEFGFATRVALVAAPFEGRQLIQLEFATRVPWIIAEPEPQ